MDPVHIGGHEKPPHYAVQTHGKEQVSVIEQAGGVEDDLEDQHRDRGRPEDGYNGHFVQQGEQDFDRVKAHAGGYVEFVVAVVHAVEAPQQRHGV